MEKENADNGNAQKIALGTKELISIFYDKTSKDYEILSKLLFNPKYEVYTTVLNVAEFHHILKEKENNVENFKEKFNSIYNKISSCIKIEKYCLDENFLEEYVKNYSNNSIFDFAFTKFCEDSNLIKSL